MNVGQEYDHTICLGFLEHLWGCISAIGLFPTMKCFDQIMFLQIGKNSYTGWHCCRKNKTRIYFLQPLKIANYQRDIREKYKSRKMLTFLTSVRIEK